jgi:DNA-binding response OmpR family regulator
MTRILLVDDDPVQLEMWRVLLRQAGHEIETAAARDEAAQLLLSFAPDILVMDLGVPTPAEGEKLMAETRRIAPGVRILLLTGAPEMLSELAVPDEVFQKPVRVEHLLAAVARSWP